jgi:Fe-S-cluster containining protein
MRPPPDYPELLARLDAWQHDVRERFPGGVPCRSGCSACCRGPFDISAADVMVVRAGVASLPGEVRVAVEQQARIQVGRMARSEPDFAFPWDVSCMAESRFDALVHAQAGEPCPALDFGGRCLIYQWRPMVCRMMGLGMRTGSGSPLENGCPIRDDFPAYRDLPLQEFDLERWEQEERGALEAAGSELFPAAPNPEFETTVAGAILLGAPESWRT